MIITLNKDLINGLDVSRCPTREATFSTPCGVIDNMPYGSNHYRLLCYLSSLFNDVLFGDIGTAGGESAMALGFNSKNRVISFDIQDYAYVKLPNAVYVIGNFWNHKEDLLDATCILYDIPHSNHQNEMVPMVTRCPLEWISSFG